MGKSVVRFGDADVPHCSGMTRLGASTNVFINGRGVSRRNDSNTGHTIPIPNRPCGPHVGAIAVGSTKVFANAKFDIPVGTVNTENPDRDKKIVDHFFGTFTDTKSITGSVSHIDGDSATFSIEMNGVANEVTGHFSVEGETVTLSTTIDLGNWQGEAAVKALNDVCNDLHKGEDGVSKLWPNVDVKIETTLTKECK